LVERGAIPEPLFHALDGGVSAMCLSTSAIWPTTGYRYALLEAGHRAHNVLLTCTAMGIAAMHIGGFLDDECGLLFGHQPQKQKLLCAALIGHAPKCIP
jgi:nitroreductase